MKKPKDCYSNPYYTWLRVALWQAYDYKDYYKGEVIAFREMEIDHIVPQEAFRDPDKLQVRLKELGLPDTFKKDDLRNYVPTRRGTNTEKYKLEGDNVIIYALQKAKQMEPIIKEKIDFFFSDANAVDEATRIAANITSQEQRYNVIDIILHDTEDFSGESTVDQGLPYRGLPGQFVKSTKNVRLIGFLPNFKQPTPSCVIEFRTLLLRGITLCVSGSEVLGSLCRGNHTPIDGGLRSYLQKDMHNDYFHWRLGNCGFRLARGETEELCTIIDEYTQAYINALRSCEKTNDLEDCRLAEGGVRLFRIRQSIYHCIYQYIAANPTCYRQLRLECNQNMFRLDSCNGRLHFMIMLESAQATYWNNEPEFWVTLKSYYGEHDGLMDREELWSPTQVRRWLLEKLIPDAIKHFMEKCAPRKPFGKKRSSMQIKDAVKRCMEEIAWSIKALDQRIADKISSDQELLDAVNRMQQHFSLSSAPDHYSQDGLKIYDALLVLLERASLQKYSYGYISGKLGCQEADSKEELIKFVEDSITGQKEKKFYTAGEIEVVLRCLRECIEKNTGELGFQTILIVTSQLSDLIAAYNREVLINKYL